jgi:arylsulfatase A-like enzyme
MWRWVAVALCLLGSTVWAQTPPNIVVVITDDLTWNELQDHALDPASPHYLPDYMPNLKALFQAQGLTFTRFYVTQGWCCPSRASILRGQYPHNTGITTLLLGFQNFVSFGLEASTVATWLHQGGYTTVLLGKYLNGYPILPGETEPSPYVPPGWSEWYGLAQESAYYNYDLVENGTFVHYGTAQADYSTDVLSAKAIDFLNRVGSVPFFMYLAPIAPHKPATPAARHTTLFSGVTAPRKSSFNEADMTDKPWPYAKLAVLTPSQIAQIDALYRKRLQALMAVDDLLGALVQTLMANGQLANTYIFVTSDNGFHFGEHRLALVKNHLFEESVHVPLFVRGPGILPGTRDQLVLNNDLAATWVELAGSAGPEYAMDGRSIVPLLAPMPPLAWRTHALLFGLVNGYATRQVAGQQVLYAEFERKGVAPSPYNRMWYDLDVDPYQEVNAYDAVHVGDPDRLDHSIGQLAALRDCIGTQCAQAENPPTPLMTMTVTPDEVTVVPQAMVQFTATGEGTPNTAIIWTTEREGGTITQGGLYKAPALPGWYRVVALSQADRSVWAVARVHVVP